MKRTFLFGTISALTLGAVVLTSVAPAAMARGFGGDHGGARGPAMFFQKFDADQNGALTLDEVQAGIAEHFATIDADGDGSVTTEELQAMRPQMKMGKGHDGGKRGFGRMGGDHDGRSHGDRDMAMRGGEQGFGHGKRMMPQMSDEDRADRAAKMIEQRDTNGDGMLSVDELAAAPKQMTIFDRFDTNGDGTITAEEFEAARKPVAPAAPTGEAPAE